MTSLMTAPGHRLHGSWASQCIMEPETRIFVSGLHTQVGSYNVNGKKPPPGTKLDDWLGPKWRNTWPQSDSRPLAGKPQFIASMHNAI